MGFYLKPVFDISMRIDTPDVCGLSKFVSAADIQQLVDLLRPSDNVGMVWVSSVTPDIATYPELKNFIWIDLSTGHFPYAMRVYNWDMNSWDVIRQADGTVSGEVLADRSIKIVKLLPDPNTAGQVIVVNADSTKFVYVWAKDAIADKTLEINKLKVPDGTAEQSYLTHTSKGVLGFTSLTSSQIITLIGDNTLPISKLTTTGGAALQSIRVKSDLTKFEFYTPSAGASGPVIPPPDVAHAGNIIDISTGGVYQLVPFNTKLDPALQNFKMKMLGPIALPGISGTATPLAHGYAKVPQFLRPVLVCITAHDGWAKDDEIDSSFATDQEGYPLFHVYADITNVKCFRHDSVTSIMQGPTALADRNTFKSGSWQLKYYVGTLL